MRVVALGTGQALDLARRGDADVVFVHARAAEERFLAEGHGVQRFPVMYNDFVLIGPKSDPARIAGGTDTLDALQKIKGANAPFVSRGDGSGTHIAEVDLWKMAGVDIGSEKGPWYLRNGPGHGSGAEHRLVAERLPARGSRNLDRLQKSRRPRDPRRGRPASHEPIWRHGRESRETPERQTRGCPGFRGLARFARRVNARSPTTRSAGSSCFSPTPANRAREDRALAERARGSSRQRWLRRRSAAGPASRRRARRRAKGR